MAGTVKFFDAPFTSADLATRRAMLRSFGMLFQGGALWTSLTLRENVALPLEEYTTLTRREIEELATLKLAQVGLTGFEDYYPSEISGGMKKRAGLARAMALDPAILFFDEPSAGLDPVVSAELDELILRLRDALRMTIVVVTHELESAFKIADTITVLDAGENLMTGTVAEVRATSNERIQDLLNRRPREVTVDADAYLKRLTEEEA